MTQPWLARRRPGPRPLIEDPQFRMRALALATTGISRKGASLSLGVEEHTLLEWLARGRAHPDVEPWGSFATEYRRAERGLEEAAATSIGLWVAHIAARVNADPDFLHPDKPVGRADIELLNKILERRHPADHGTSPHRLVEADPDGSAWLERHQLTQEQLTEMFRKPPEPVQEALVAAADEVYALLCASGWSPEGRQPDGMVSVPSDGDGRGEDRSEGETGPRE